jgi:predicted DNA-binding ribbon-helix-helix protein
MRRSLELALTDFSRSSLEEMARRQGVSVSTLLARATLYYLVERESDRQAARVPRLPREPSVEKKDGVLRVTIELRAAAWRDLDRATESEGLSVERLLEHAALLFLADLESGRVAARLLESAEAEVE